jgi:hypothetical protein
MDGSMSGEVHIGNAQGKIAIWFNEQEAYDLAAMYKYPDGFIPEIISAIDKAYPKREDSDG